MNRTESLAGLAPALTAAIAKIEGVKKDRENPFFKSHYATLGAVIEAARGALAENGLAVIQLPGVAAAANTLCLETIILHKSGEFISSETTVPLAKNDPQGYGSAMTYARRYGLMAALGIAAEDDDGNAASGSAAASQTRPGPDSSRVSDMKLAIGEAGSKEAVDNLMAGIGDWPDDEYNQIADAATSRVKALSSFAAPIASAKLNPPAWYLDATGKPLCQHHKTPLKFHEEGKYGPWWSCTKKIDGEWCKAKANNEEVESAAR